MSQLEGFTHDRRDYSEDVVRQVRRAFRWWVHFFAPENSTELVYVLLIRICRYDQLLLVM